MRASERLYALLKEMGAEPVVGERRYAGETHCIVGVDVSCPNGLDNDPVSVSDFPPGKRVVVFLFDEMGNILPQGRKGK
jgi:hypothetical protein